MTVFASFQMMFAVITPLLITGAFSERVDFGAFVAFIILWSIIIYYPVCHWVWGGGLLTRLGGSKETCDADGLCVENPDFNGGAVDFAGGIVIHTTAGVSSLVVALVLGPREGFNPESTSWNTEARPHSIPLATIGAAMLWMGWFGFNAGSALASGKPSIVATLNGSIAGLAGVTPASGFITSQSAFILGIVLGFASYYSVKLLKGKLKIDDALDVSSVHGCTGIVGSLAVGLIGDKARVTAAAGANIYGLFFGGGWYLLLWQTIAVLVAGIWSGVWTWVICKILERTTGFRVSTEQEAAGLDVALHGETARILDVSPNALSPMHAAAMGTALPQKFKLDAKTAAATDAESLTPVPAEETAAAETASA
jgi:Amt family ammonium transporter